MGDKFFGGTKVPELNFADCTSNFARSAELNTSKSRFGAIRFVSHLLLSFVCNHIVEMLKSRPLYKKITNASHKKLQNYKQLHSEIVMLHFKRISDHYLLEVFQLT